MAETTIIQPQGLAQGLDVAISTFAPSTPTPDGTTALTVGRSGSADRYRAIVDFDLTGIRYGEEGIGRRVSVSAAVLTLYCTSAASAAYGCRVHPLERDVTIVTASTTWTVQDGSRSWLTAGGDYDLLSYVEFDSPDATGTFEIDGLEDIVQAAIDDGATHLGLLIRKTDEASGTSTFAFGRSNQPYAATSRAPKLTVTWSHVAASDARAADPPASASTVAAMTGIPFFSPSRVGSSVLVRSAHPSTP